MTAPEIDGQLDILDLLATQTPATMPARRLETIGHLISSQYPGHHNPVAYMLAGWRPGPNRDQVLCPGRGDEKAGGQIRWQLCSDRVVVDYHRLEYDGSKVAVNSEPWQSIAILHASLTTWIDSLPDDLHQRATAAASGCKHGTHLPAPVLDILNQLVSEAIDLTPTPETLA